MRTKDPCPAYVEPMKVLEWEEKSPFDEGIVSIQVMFEESHKLCNWLLFYTWCYARTQGFRNKCMKDWDFGNYGGKFKTCRDGVRDALSEFIKYEDTNQLQEQVDVENLYLEIEAFCKGVIYDNPKPLPEPPKPKPEPIPEPQPDPQPEPQKPSEPSQPGKPFDWIKMLKIVGPILAAVLTFGGLFLPGWAKTVLDIIVKIISGITG